MTGAVENRKKYRKVSEYAKPIHKRRRLPTSTPYIKQHALLVCMIISIIASIRPIGRRSGVLDKVLLLLEPSRYRETMPQE